MAEITLHLNDYRMEALEEALEDSGGVERTMQDYLIDLYSETVPFEKQREIQKRIDAERQRGNPEPGAAAVQPDAPEENQYPILTAVRPLQPGDIEFRDDVLQFNNLLNFKFDPDLPLCEMFGVHDDIMKPGGLISVYVDYDLEAEKPENCLQVTLSSAKSGGSEDFRYPLSAEEIATLLPKMEDYCQWNRGESLADCAAAYRAAESLKREQRTAKRHGKSGKSQNPAR